MWTLLKRFVREEDGQDFTESALILEAVGVMAIAGGRFSGLEQIPRNMDPALPNSRRL